VIPLDRPADSRPDEPPDQPPDDAGTAEPSVMDTEAFGVLYDQSVDQIYRYAHRRLGDHAAAEDVTADVFFRALRALHTYRPDKAPFAAWLYGIAANAVIDHIRARKLTLSLDVLLDAADQARPVEDQALDRVEADTVWRAIDGLSDAQRTAVTLRFGHDLPIAAIAERLERSEGAVKLLLNRGLTKVREQLQAAGRDGEGGNK
jgi:RNA polymerase sigma-70 factor (ECF subfamily)